MPILPHPKTGVSIINAAYALEITLYQLINHLQQLEWIYDVAGQWQPSIVFSAENYIEPRQRDIKQYREEGQEVNIPQIWITFKGMNWLKYYLRH